MVGASRTIVIPFTSQQITDYYGLHTLTDTNRHLDGYDSPLSASEEKIGEKTEYILG